LPLRPGLTGYTAANEPIFQDLLAASSSSCDAPGENLSKKVDNFFGPLLGEDEVSH
jgi:hypothetical protein